MVDEGFIPYYQKGVEGDYIDLFLLTFTVVRRVLRPGYHRRSLGRIILTLESCLVSDARTKDQVYRDQVTVVEEELAAETLVTQQRTQ